MTTIAAFVGPLLDTKPTGPTRLENAAEIAVQPRPRESLRHSYPLRYRTGHTVLLPSSIPFR